MKNLLKSLFRKKIITEISSITEVKVLEISKVIHDRRDWTIIESKVQLNLNGMTIDH